MFRSDIADFIAAFLNLSNSRVAAEERNLLIRQRDERNWEENSEKDKVDAAKVASKSDTFGSVASIAISLGKRSINFGSKST